MKRKEEGNRQLRGLVDRLREDPLDNLFFYFTYMCVVPYITESACTRSNSTETGRRFRFYPILKMPDTLSAVRHY